MFDKVEKDEVVALLAIVGAIYVATEVAHRGWKLTKKLRGRKDAKASS